MSFLLESWNFYLPLVQFLSIHKCMSEVQHSIKIAARKSGLTPHVIRVWEKRYDAVSPNRTDTNRRLYSEAEIERLTLLRAATQGGHSISNVAQLPTEKLRELVSEVPAPIAGRSDDDPVIAPLIGDAVAAVQENHGLRLEEILSRAAVQLGSHGVLERMIAPLAHRIGELWQEGTLTAAHEHFASAVIRNFLIRHSRPYAVGGNTPTIVVATPTGQLHELGAVLAAAAANDMGWRVIYLGTSLPALEMAGAVVRNQARALALSIVFPGDDPNLPGELETLQKSLPATVKVIAGGRAAGSYATVLERCGFVRNETLSEFYGVLEAMRQGT
jgi:DNA-binding transcriptional MerR regulator/methylmalonyl-CoA mutase cobalamin-binding subunit